MTDFRVRHSKNFVMGHINLNSYRHKFVFMYDVLTKGSVDVLFISESKIDESFPSAQFLIPDFIIHLQDNTANSDGLIAYPPPET